MPVNAAESTKCCTVCRQILPVTEFRRRAHGEQRESRCRGCYNAWSRDYRRRRKLQGIRQFAREVRKQTDRDYIATALEEMYRSFGGWQNFIAAWMSEIHAERKRPRPRRFLGDSMLAIVRLMDLCEQNRPQIDVSLLSDGELENRIEQRLRTLYGASPSSDG